MGYRYEFLNEVSLLFKAKAMIQLILANKEKIFVNETIGTLFENVNQYGYYHHKQKATRLHSSGYTEESYYYDRYINVNHIIEIIDGDNDL